MQVAANKATAKMRTRHPRPESCLVDLVLLRSMAHCNPLQRSAQGNKLFGWQLVIGPDVFVEELKRNSIRAHARFHFPVREGDFVNLESEVPNAFLFDE